MATHEPSGGGGPTLSGPVFPQRNAFVVQFAAGSGPRTRVFRGRVQHVASGQQAAFGSLEELRAFVEVLLGAGAVPEPVGDDG